MATKANLIMDQGASFNTTIDVTDTSGNIISLSGYSGYSQIKKAYSSLNVTAIFVVNVIGSNGQLQLLMDANTTSRIDSGRYVYDVLVSDPSNNWVRVVEGELLVTPMVSVQSPVNVTIIVATSNISATLSGDSSGSGEE